MLSRGKRGARLRADLPTPDEGLGRVAGNARPRVRGRSEWVATVCVFVCTANRAARERPKKGASREPQEMEWNTYLPRYVCRVEGVEQRGCRGRECAVPNVASRACHPLPVAPR